MSALPSELVPQDGPDRIPEEGGLVHVGEWYWVSGEDDDDKHCFFGCVVHIGSNFAELENVYHSTKRVHLDKFDAVCKREWDPEKVIKGHIDRCRADVRQHLGQIRKVAERLGLDAEKARPSAPADGAPSQTRALSVLSQSADLKKYKKDLIRAKDEQLPELFKKVEESHKQLATWMAAQAIPAKALTRGMKDVIEDINGRVFNISLYAGLTEGVVQILEGPPAAAAEKLKLFQRMLYMDEECLLQYRSGGMDFDNIGEFDQWIAQPEHLALYLPTPRSMVAFQIRRKAKDRPWDGSLRQAFINFFSEQDDKRTFFYIRNGGNLWRMDSDLALDEHIFPGRHELDLSEPMMARSWCSDIQDLIPKRQFDDMVERHRKNHALYEAWEREHRKAKPKDQNPHWQYASEHTFSDWHPFNRDSVYYDEMTKAVADRVTYYQRIALILQGLYDRSMVFHPHPRVCLWDPDGFHAAVELVYDADNILDYGAAPDFEAYRARLNASLGDGSVTIGQEDFWERLMWDREKNRWNGRPLSEHERWYKTHHRPDGDPGPGYCSKVARWRPGAAAATFRWTRERRSMDRWIRHTRGDVVETQVTVPAEKLFNVSAYRPGDYKAFYVDPRTRQNYLQWAPLLIAAEEFHAKNLTAGGELIRKNKRARRGRKK